MFRSISIRTCILLVACALGPAAGLSSTLALQDYKTAGDQLLIHDTLTSRDWLKLTYAQGETVVNAEAVNPGFDLATPTQAQGLFADAGGFTAFDGVNRVADQPTAGLPFNLVGPTTFANFGGGQFEAQLYGHVARPNTSTYDEYFVDLRNRFAFPGGAVSFIALGNDDRRS